jgi:hypothetical protein
MLTTRFRVWLQHPRIAPVWTGVKFVDLPEHIEVGCKHHTVKWRIVFRRIAILVVLASPLSVWIDLAPL